MRISVSGIAAFVLTLTMAASATHAGEALDRVHKTGVVVDALVNDYPPFAFINDKNELDGFDVDVAKAFAEKLGVKLKLELPGWETIVGGKWAGRWDVGITSTTPTEDRAKVLNFPVIYYSVPGGACGQQGRAEHQVRGSIRQARRRWVGLVIRSLRQSQLHYSRPSSLPSTTCRSCLATRR